MTCHCNGDTRGHLPAVTVWADGFGVWHASVPFTIHPNRNAHAARAAIKAELAARGESPAYPLRVTIERHTGHGTVIYREV